MTVRPMVAADHAEIARMAAAFLGPEGPYFGRFRATEAALEALIARMGLETALALVLEASPGHLVGMFGAFVFLHPIIGEIVGSELCWWVDPEARGSLAAGRMIEQAIAWARGAGAVWFEMIAPNERIAAFYERLGFQRTDIHYMKVL